MPDTTPDAPAPAPAPASLVAPAIHPILAHLWDGTKTVARAIRKAVVFLYNEVVHVLGPAIGSEYGKLHVGDLAHSLMTTLLGTFSFSSIGGFLGFALGYLIPPLTALATSVAAVNPFEAGALILVVDLLRRVSQVSPTPIPVAPTPTPAPAPAPPVATAEFPTLTP